MSKDKAEMNKQAKKSEKQPTRVPQPKQATTAWHDKKLMSIKTINF